MNCRNDGYRLRNIKTFTGRDGYGFSARLYKDKESLADVLDEGCGAECVIHWLRAGSRQQDCLDFDSFITSLPPLKLEGESLSMDATSFFAGLVDTHQTIQDLRRKAKKSVVFVNNGEVFTVKPRPGHTLDRAIQAVGVKYPTAAILNAKDEEEWVELVPGLS